MKRMTVLSAGGEFQHEAEIAEEDKPKKKKGKGKKGKKDKEEPEEEPLIINRKTLHEAYYFLKETYVDKLEEKNAGKEGEEEERIGIKDVQKITDLKLKVEKIPGRQRRKSLNNNLALEKTPTTRRKSLNNNPSLKSPNLSQRRRSISRARDE